jgi:hypothetical protein
MPAGGNAAASSGGTSSAATGGSGATTSTGGAAGSGGLAPCEPTAASIQQTIILPSCTSHLCHGDGAPAAALDLSTPDWTSTLVDTGSSTCDGWTRVVPGNPEQSFLYEKLTKDMPACGGERMPNGSVLPDAYITCIRDWIVGLGAGGCETCGGSACVSLASDANHCGACDTTCPAGSACVNGACACPGGQAACGSSCVDVATDNQNCGTCGNACASGSTCSAGQCACTGSLAACGNGCYDLTSDAAHCGDCKTACGASEVCLNGTCSSGCGSLTQCGASCVDLKSSSANCGTCGTVCAAGLSCNAGKCGCAAGQTLCGGNCVDVASDDANCGACGKSCGPGSTCSSGKCQCGSTTVSFGKDVQPIFTANCVNAGCHSGAKPKEGLSLESGKSYGDLVGAASTECNGGLLVKAGDVPGSYLVNKLLGTNLCSGSQMPKAGQSLASADLAKISDWICQGAPSN